MLVGDYGSDNSDSEPETTPVAPAPAPKPAAPAPPSTKSGLLSSLPPPKSGGAGASGLSLPPPSKKKHNGPVRITIDAPSKRSATPADAVEDDAPALKKLKTEGGGGGMSALLGMLPAPKRSSGIVLPAPKAKQTEKLSVVDSFGFGKEEMDAVREAGASASATGLVPPSVGNKAAAGGAKGKGKAQAAPAMDFFSLGTSAPAPRPTPAKPAAPAAPAAPTTFLSTSTTTSILPSSAPEPPPFVPPPPTPYDPYPGYYQLPSGEWAQHDPEVYQAAYRSWQAANGVDVSALEEREAAELQGKNVVDVNAKDNLAKIERPAQLPAAAAAPEVKIPKKGPQGRGARVRGQLSALLSEAHDRRAELEEQIARNKQTRAHSGTKYGF